MKFEEEHDVGSVKKFASACGARASNAENQKAYYESRIPSPIKRADGLCSRRKSITRTRASFNRFWITRPVFLPVSSHQDD